MVSQGVSWKSFSMTTDIILPPPGWGRASTATTLPETLARMGAPRPAISPIFWPTFTSSPTATMGLQGAPTCMDMGITT